VRLSQGIRFTGTGSHPPQGSAVILEPMDGPTLRRVVRSISHEFKRPPQGEPERRDKLG